MQGVNPSNLGGRKDLRIRTLKENGLDNWGINLKFTTKRNECTSEKKIPALKNTGGLGTTVRNIGVRRGIWRQEGPRYLAL